MSTTDKLLAILFVALVMAYVLVALWSMREEEVEQLKVNDRVEIHGRNSFTEFNGKKGTIIEIDPKAFAPECEGVAYTHVRLDEPVKVGKNVIGSELVFKSTWQGIKYLKKIE